MCLSISIRQSMRFLAGNDVQAVQHAVRSSFSTTSPHTAKRSEARWQPHCQDMSTMRGEVSSVVTRGSCCLFTTRVKCLVRIIKVVSEQSIRNGYRRIDNLATSKSKISTLTSCGKALRADTTDRHDRRQPHHLRSVVSLCECTTWSRSYFKFCPAGYGLTLSLFFLC